MTSAFFRGTTSQSIAGHNHGEKQKKRGRMEWRGSALLRTGRKYYKQSYLETKEETDIE